MADLDSRKQSILRAVIFEYVRDAEPVGSEVLANRYPLGVKSATIRNELADLAEQGYLDQPHTSAGRIPSDLGYRFYVDRLIVQREPDADARQKMKGAAQEGEALEHLVAETTRLLSRLTQNLTAASLNRESQIMVRSGVVSALGPKQAMAVFVLGNGHVESRMLEVPAELTLTELGQANEFLGRNLFNVNLKSTARSKPPTFPENPATERLLAAVWTALKSVSKEVNRPVTITEGEEFLLGQPEFRRDAQALGNVLEALQQEDLLANAISGPGDKVSIGRENRHVELHGLSIVRQSFYVGEHEAGVIAVVGPTRMAYESSIPLVDFTARSLTDALTKYLGQG